MKKIFTIATVLLTAFTIQVRAQILTPVHWSYAAKKVSKDEAIIFMKAAIDEGWHLYSQTVKEGGPVKTTITFPAAKTYLLVGKTIEQAPITKYEKVFSMDVSFFEREALFQQKVKLKAGQVTVKGTIEYMTCNDHQCLPPEDIEFSVAIK